MACVWSILIIKTESNLRFLCWGRWFNVDNWFSCHTFFKSLEYHWCINCSTFDCCYFLIFNGRLFFYYNNFWFYRGEIHTFTAEACLLLCEWPCYWKKLSISNWWGSVLEIMINVPNCFFLMMLFQQLFSSVDIEMRSEFQKPFNLDRTYLPHVLFWSNYNLVI